jgi:hypothetical protein
MHDVRHALNELGKLRFGEMRSRKPFPMSG